MVSVVTFKIKISYCIRSPPPLCLSYLVSHLWLTTPKHESCLGWSGWYAQCQCHSIGENWIFPLPAGINESSVVNIYSVYVYIHVFSHFKKYNKINYNKLQQKLSYWNQARQTDRRKRPQETAQESEKHSYTGSGLP